MGREVWEVLENKMKTDLQKTIEKILENSGVESPHVFLDVPIDPKMGDYSTNVALTYAKNLGKKPLELAEEINSSLQKEKKEYLSRVEVAGPGFINFYFAPEFFTQNIFNTKHTKRLTGQKVIIEYTDPNPFKEFHIGHLMSNAIGEALSRIIEGEGADVKRLSYGGDVGLHVAKAIFGVLSQKKQISETKNKSEKEQLSFWAHSYVFGSTKYDEDENAKKEIDVLNKTIFDKSDPEINSLYDWGREVSIKHLQEMFERLDTHFYKNFWESDVVEDAMKAVELGLQKNVLEKSEGAIIFRGENYGLHTRVFVNSKGVPTYEAKELGLALRKYRDFAFDKSIVITGNEQNDYFKVLLKAMDVLVPESAHKTVHIGHGMLRFAEGKMSSRKGNVITAENLLNEIKEKILEKMNDREMDEHKKAEVAEIVTIGALKYSILRQTVGKDIIFDFEKSLSFEGDSGPYLQYATVRAMSIVKKAEGSVKLSEKIPENWQTTHLERLLERFDSVVERSGDEYAPHYIVTHLTELAGEFNSFYATHKIIDETDNTSPYKIALTKIFATSMTNGLSLLGIKVPTEM